MNNAKGIAIKILVLLLILGAAGASFYFYSEFRKSEENLKKLTLKYKKDPKALAVEETKTLVAQVAKHMALPEKEDPIIATVTDIKRLKDQPFFAKAQNGDKVLIYTNAKKAILYRPSSDKIIEVAPVNTSKSDDKSATTSKTVKVAYYNGTLDQNATKNAESSLKAKLPDLATQVLARSNAKSLNYTSTLVVDLVGTQTALSERIATALGGKVGKLPAGESKPQGAEILIIVGGNPIPTAAATPTNSPTVAPSATPTQ